MMRPFVRRTSSARNAEGMRCTSRRWQKPMGVFLALVRAVQLIDADRLVYLNAGVRPKKAMKVRTETVTVKMTMLRTRVMVKVGRDVWAWRGRSGLFRVCYAASSACTAVWLCVSCSAISSQAESIDAVVKLHVRGQAPRCPRGCQSPLPRLPP